MMKLLCSGPKFFVCLFLVLASSIAFAQVTVGCPGGTPGTFNSLNNAIAASPDHTTFLVSGTCTENIVVQKRNDLNFFGNPTATIQPADATIEVMSINSSQNISFNNGFVITGGQGIAITISSSVHLSGLTVQNSGGLGITAVDSVVHLLSSSITSNTRSGIVVTGGAFYLDGNVNVSNNGRLGISANSGHLTMSDGLGPNIVSHNGLAGVQIFGIGQGDFSGDNELTNNAGGNAGLLVFNQSGVFITNGLINGNTGTGVTCAGNSHCEFSGTQINSNTLGGIQIVQHADGAFDGAVTISGNTGTGVLVDQSSSLVSLGGNTISNNTGDGLVLNTISAMNFLGTDVITATTGNLALNCNNGSLVEGDVSTYKPKKCGAQFQVVPIH
ncbi:MAG TPA: right-handed parallel beta-helix repeat-containing protein [Candidatus Angelobacter sp.]|nr:right-handed parallel beta-helix repeat-containing protein [Candidatus Angelobacter sp.]